MIGKRQFRFRVELCRLFVVFIQDIPACPIDADAVSVCVTSLIITLKEQMIRRTDRPVITIGNIYQIVVTVIHCDNVPHMAAAPGTACHLTGGRETENIRVVEIRQIAKIFKCLRISLADHLVCEIIIKYIDHLPGIHGTKTAAVPGCSSVIIVRDAVTYILFISNQLLIICFISCCRNNVLRIDCRNRSRGGKICIRLII